MIAIVATLAFLALEIRQNTTAMNAAAYQSRSDALQNLAVVAANSEVISRIQANYLSPREGCEGVQIECSDINYEYIDGLSPTERQQFRNYLAAQAHRISNLTVQYQFGLLTDEYHRNGVVRIIKNLMPMWEAFDVSQRRRLAAYVEDFERENLIPDE